MDDKKKLKGWKTYTLSATKGKATTIPPGSKQDMGKLKLMEKLKAEARAKELELINSAGTPGEKERHYPQVITIKKPEQE